MGFILPGNSMECQPLFISFLLGANNFPIQTILIIPYIFNLSSPKKSPKLHLHHLL